jgi:exodeoxyribonuclease V alpha subunit
MPLPSIVAGGAADITGTLAAVHFRDERGFAIFSIDAAQASRVRALGYLAPAVGLRAVVRAVGTWTQHARYGWQLQVRTLELIDHLDRRGVVAFLVAYTTHLGPVRAAEAVQLFGQRVFEVIREHPEELCAIKGVTPARAQAIQSSFAAVANIANVDSWLRHIGLGKADARRVRDAYGDDAARLVRENPYRLADEIHGIGFLTADSLRVMLGIGPTSAYRLHAALRYTLDQIARLEGHVYLPLAELVDRTARQLDERRATTGRWAPEASLVSALREYLPTFTTSEDAAIECGPSGNLAADDARIYSRQLYEAECGSAERLRLLLAEEAPLFKSAELEAAIRRAEQDNGLVLEADQRRAIGMALSQLVSIISGGPGVGKTTSIRILVQLLEQRGVPYLLLSPTGKAAKRLQEATLRSASTIHRQLFSLERQKEQLQGKSRRRAAKAARVLTEEIVLPADAIIVDEASMVDVPLLAWLLRSVGPRTRLIFVG